MSAFIVDDRVINRIVTKITRHMRLCLDHPFKQLGYNLSLTDDCERLARDLHLLNCDAVDQRYAKGTAAKDVQVCYEFRFADASMIQVYKHACCLKYQCSEGEIPNHPLYKALKQFIAMLADRIISQTPEYESAQWDGHA